MLSAVSSVRQRRRVEASLSEGGAGFVAAAFHTTWVCITDAWVKRNGSNRGGGGGEQVR